MRRAAHVILGVLAVISALMMAGGALWMIWASTLAEPGHAVESGQPGMAVLWSGIICWIVSGLGFAVTIE